MSNPAPSLPSYLVTDWVCSGDLQHFLVWNMLLPSDAEDSSEALVLEDLKFIFLPSFTAIENFALTALKT